MAVIALQHFRCAAVGLGCVAAASGGQGMGRLAIGLGVVVLVIAVVLLASWLVLRRPDIPFEKLEAKYAVPTSHFVDLGDGVRVHYRDDGDPAKPVILLVHGFGDSFLTWEGW